MNRRAYQREALREFTEAKLRMFALLWERQSGKSTTFADLGLYEMMRHKWRTCVYASASLLLAQEIVLKQSQRVDTTAREIVSKESALLSACAGRYSEEAAGAGMLFRTADAASGEVKNGLTPEDFAELFESQRLEFRVYHDRGAFSRMKVIAPNIATARSWSGLVFLDEVAFIRQLKELMVALLPVISTNPDFKLILGTTPPEFDDTHYSFELLAPPAGLEFKPDAMGNWYDSELGIRVHRADAFDTHLAGKKIYDVKTGKEITPAEAFAKALNKDGHRIAHHLAWMLGGAAACDLLKLRVAQERGIGQCHCAEIGDDAAFEKAQVWLAEYLHPEKKVGLGFDVATTTKQKSNPSVLSVVEEHSPEKLVRMLMVWRTKDPDVARYRIGRVLEIIGKRKGGRARAMALDATNERYFAEDCRKIFRARVPVLLVVSSEAVDKPGLEKPTNWKEFLGDQYVGLLEDNHLTLPPESYVRTDHRLVMRDRGRFVCEPDDEGRHGDTFDAGKLGVHALVHRGADARAVPMAVGSYQTTGRPS